MNTLIDALKGLLGKLEDYDPTDGRRECDRYELQKVQLVEEIAHQLSEIIAEHERSAEPVKCKCGSTPNEDHTCPFKLEINGNDDLCNCCDSCRHECAMDI